MEGTMQATKEIVVEVFDDHKADQLIATLTAEVMAVYTKGTVTWLTQNHFELFTNISSAEEVLTATRLAADMKAYHEGIKEYRRLWLNACDLYRLHLEHRG